MLSRRSPVILVQNIIGAILGIVGLFFITRFVGTTDWGFVSFGIGFVGILSLFGDLGYSTAHNIKLSQGEEIETCNGTYLTIKLILSFLFIVIVTGSLLIWTHVLHRGFQSPVEYWIILVLIPYFFFSNFIGFTKTFYVANLKSTRIAIPPVIEALLRNSVFIALGLAIRYSILSNAGYFPAILVAAAYSVSYAVYFLTSFILGRPWKIARPTRKMLKAYTALALPLSLVSVVGTVNGNIDKVIIEFYWHATATGAFFSSQNIALVIASISASMSIFFLPMLVRISKEHQREEHEQTIKEFERLISLFILPLVVDLAVLAEYFMNIFSQAYIAYSAILTVLSVRTYFSAINSPYSSAIMSRQRTGRIAIIDFLSVIGNIALILILVPPAIFGITFFSLGAVGAAVATTSITILDTFLYRISLSKLDKTGYNFHIARHIIPAAVQTAFIMLVVHFVSPKNILILAPLSIAAIAIYFLIAIAMRETSFSDIASLIRSFMPKAIMKQFREE
ncbi:oligosaccharide flippase family protein [Oxyplasma meridianum]|uniref:Oligosaccharide flippase family protein n=1 Tax=Oxyplasma meridianum TaxID=3073602 RepID=A0AAX4NF50_9ARCH